MARIRTIKPEFWVDPKIAKLPKATALFFVALWNFADDQGIVEDDSRSLSLRVPIYRSQDIQKMLNALWQEGLIKRSPVDGLVFISGWKHQKIDKPRDGKWKDKEIHWLTWGDSEKALEESSNVRRKDRIGKDRIGSGKDMVAGDVKSPRKPAKIPEVVKPAKTAEVWEAYGEAYEGRFGEKPADNAVERKHLSRFIDLVGADIAPAIARFYLIHPNAYYLQKGYPTWLLAQDAQKLRMEYLTGNTITRQKAQDTERAFGNLEAFGLFGGESNRG